jgi:hypothetical protein
MIRRSQFLVDINKLGTGIVAFFGITMVMIIGFFSGKPYDLEFVTKKIVEELKVKVKMISNGTDKKNDGNTYFIFREDKNDSKELIAALTKELRVSPDYCSIVDWDKDCLAVKLTDKGMLQVNAHIQTFPNIVEKIIVRKIGSFDIK